MRRQGGGGDMSDKTWTVLKTLLVERYDYFIQRLSRHLGSKDRAEEALQDTFLRLAGGGEIGDVRHPSSFLYRMAFNEAGMRARKERRQLGLLEADMLLAAIDAEPGPERIAAARSDLQAVRKLLDELPERRRAIFEAAYFQGLPHRQIAERHKVSQRMIQYELHRVILLIDERLNKSGHLDFMFPDQKASES